MSDTAILGVAGIVGTLLGSLGGAWLGSSLQDRSERRRHLRDACERLATGSLETVTYLMEVEAHYRGGPAPTVPRPDLGHDWYGALTVAQLGPHDLGSTIGVLSDALQTAVLLHAPGSTDAEREKARANVMSTLADFNAAASEALNADWSTRLSRRLRGR